MFSLEKFNILRKLLKSCVNQRDTYWDKYLIKYHIDLRGFSATFWEKQFKPVLSSTAY